MGILLAKSPGASDRLCIVCGTRWKGEGDSPCGHVNSDGRIILSRVPDNFPLTPKD